ncbi:thermonuclease family protein [Acinetobacter variabilis]|uniref:thermonuclease family protein n=1 Tax=Acinetobacter variabilis TaxID=70346 RepID=UPI0028A71E00|nr:thermonuclease family protein [Acinetobacter variabilis]
MKVLALFFSMMLFNACAKTINVQVVRVLDGDTIDVVTLPANVLTYETPMRIRFANIDAPEKSQPYGMQSRAILSAAIDGKRVDINISAQDKYGRFIGTVMLNGQNINRYMVVTGSAWVYRQYCSDKHMYALELKARYAKKGLWDAPKPVAPWEYRHAG